MNVRILFLKRAGNFFGRLVRRSKEALVNAHQRDFRDATREIADWANSSMKKEQNELGDKIVLYLLSRFKKMNYGFVRIYPNKDNGSAYTIFVCDNHVGLGETEEVIIHINLHQIPCPIFVRGLYAGGIWGEEDFFSKDPVSVALLVTKVCRRIKGGVYLIKPPKETREPLDFISFALSN